MIYSELLISIVYERQHLLVACKSVGSSRGSDPHLRPTKEPVFCHMVCVCVCVRVRVRVRVRVCVRVRVRVRVCVCVCVQHT